MTELVRRLKQMPVIAAVRGEEQVKRAAQSPVQAVFLLGGDLFSLPELMRQIQDVGKLAFLHLDLIEGISRDAAGLRLVAKALKPDGVLSTRASLLKVAAEEGLMTVLRMFMVDSSSVVTGERMVRGCNPDLVELMPGLVTRAIHLLGKSIAPPVIAGGMLEVKRDVTAALEAGALAASTSNALLWTYGQPDKGEGWQDG